MHHSLPSRVRVLLVAVIAAVVVWPAQAVAGTDGSYQDVYYVDSCGAGGVLTAPVFSSTESDPTNQNLLATNACSSGGGLQLLATNGSADGSSAQWAATTPSPAIQIIGVGTTGTVDCDLGENGFSAQYFYGSNGTNYAQPPITVDCNGTEGTNGATTADSLAQKITPSRYLGFSAQCQTASCGSSAAGGLVFSAQDILLEVQDTTGPTLTPVGPDNLYGQTGWVRGTWQANLSTSDPSGVCEINAQINGAMINSYSDPAPDTSQWSQCPGGNLSSSVDTTQYANGSGAIALGFMATNAAGAQSDESAAISVDNAPVSVSLSGPTQALSTAGTQYVTATATAGPSGVSAIDCSLDGGSEQQYSGATAQVPVSGVGEHTVACYAENNAVDSSGDVASSPTESYSVDIQQPAEAAITFGKVVDPLKCRTVRERVKVPGKKRLVTKRVRRCHARTVKRRVTVTVKRHGKKVKVKRVERVVVLPHTVNQSKLRVGHGKPATVSGVLLLDGGTALGGQPVQVLTAPNNGLGQFSPAVTATTNADGSWTAKLPAGPSRLVEASYPGNASIAAAVSGQIALRVPAKLTLISVTPRVAWGATVRIVGQLHGGYLPPEGALIRLEIGKGNAVTTYGVKEHVTSDRFTTTYRFGAGDPSDHERFWFRIASLPESSYPFAPAASTKRDVLVGGHPHPPRRRHRSKDTHRKHTHHHHQKTGLLTFPWVFHRGSGGQSPPSFSIANAISAAGE